MRSQQIHFAYAKAIVLRDSFALLNQVAQVLSDFPKMKVAIEGHTDSTGPEAGNMRLSQKRANAVRDYLVSRGVSADRLEAAGLGPTPAHRLEQDREGPGQEPADRVQDRGDGVGRRKKGGGAGPRAAPPPRRAPTSLVRSLAPRRPRGPMA